MTIIQKNILFDTPKDMGGISDFIQSCPQEQHANISIGIQLTWNFLAEEIDKIIKEQQNKIEKNNNDSTKK